MRPMMRIGVVTVHVIRDSSGGMVAASNTFISYLVDSPMAKAFALKEGLMQ